MSHNKSHICCTKLYGVQYQDEEGVWHLCHTKTDKDHFGASVDIPIISACKENAEHILESFTKNNETGMKFRLAEYVDSCLMASNN